MSEQRQIDPQTTRSHTGNAILVRGSLDNGCKGRYLGGVSYLITDYMTFDNILWVWEQCRDEHLFRSLDRN